MKEKIIETIKKFSHYHATGGERCLWENRWNEVAAEIEAALLWHGPDEVPPIMDLVVEDENGTRWLCDAVYRWRVEDGGSFQLNGRTPNKWRYPAPIKKQDGGQAGE